MVLSIGHGVRPEFLGNKGSELLSKVARDEACPVLRLMFDVMANHGTPSCRTKPRSVAAKPETETIR